MMCNNENFFQFSQDGLLLIDKNGLIVAGNKCIYKILDIQGNKFIGVHLSSIIPKAISHFEKCLETAQTQAINYKNKYNKWLLMEFALLSEGEKLVICSIRMLKNSDKRESFKKISQQWQTIFTSSMISIWIFDGKGKILSINKAAEKLNGIKAKDVVGQNISDLVKNGLYDKSVCLEVIKKKRKATILQYVSNTKKYMLVTGTPIFDDSGKISLIIANGQDITRLNALKEQLERNRKITQRYKEKLKELRMVEFKKQNIVAESPQSKNIFSVATKLAKIDASNILLLGESGTGKGIVAKFIHETSHRNSKPFVQINCAAMPETLLEAELFGYEKGAFTGAREKGKIGLFELAHEGTLFLDEIGDISLSVQAKLLKCLEDHEIQPLGALSYKKINCMVIVATNADLEQAVIKGTFRKDLLYRLNAFTLKIPPLRERPEDIFKLTNVFLNKYNEKYKMKKRISITGYNLLGSYSFPGNIRELDGIIKKAIVMSDDDIIDDYIYKILNENEYMDKKKVIHRNNDGINNRLIAYEKEILEEAIQKCETTREIARYLRISQPTVVRKLKKHKLLSMGA